MLKHDLVIMNMQPPPIVIRSNKQIPELDCIAIYKEELLRRKGTTRNEFYLAYSREHSASKGAAIVHKYR